MPRPTTIDEMSAFIKSKDMRGKNIVAQSGAHIDRTFLQVAVQRREWLSDRGVGIAPTRHSEVPGLCRMADATMILASSSVAHPVIAYYRRIERAMASATH